MPLKQDTHHIGWSVLFLYFNPVLNRGNEQQLNFDDLIRLPQYLESDVSRNVFEAVAGSSDSSAANPADRRIQVYVGQEVYALAVLFWRAQKGPFLWLGVIMFFNTLLSFGGPLLIGAVVSYIQKDPNEGDLVRGMMLIGVLCGVLLLSAVLNTQNNIRGQLLQLSLKGGLSRAVFSSALSTTVYQWSLLQDSPDKLDESQVVTVMQVDVDRAAGVMTSLHNLWALPVQVIVAFVLLYSQVKLAFLVGVFLIVVMVPVNARIAARIGQATGQLMSHKDARIRLVSAVLRGIRGLKTHGWEHLLFARAAVERDGELEALATQKYLDALCVFLWAAMPVLVPFATFVTSAVVFHQQLTAPQVFTTLALLNMLVFPMNAFPWIVNGIMEARVSMRRIATCLAATTTDTDTATAPVIPTGIASSRSSGGGGGGNISDSGGVDADSSHHAVPPSSDREEAGEEKELLVKGKNEDNMSTRCYGQQQMREKKPRQKQQRRRDGSSAAVVVADVSCSSPLKYLIFNHHQRRCRSHFKVAFPQQMPPPTTTPLLPPDVRHIRSGSECRPQDCLFTFPPTSLSYHYHRQLCCRQEIFAPSSAATGTDMDTTSNSGSGSSSGSDDYVSDVSNACDVNNEDCHNGFVLRPKWSRRPLPLHLHRGDLVGVVGATAAGKSTLLLGMLGELYSTTDTVTDMNSITNNTSSTFNANSSTNVIAANAQPMLPPCRRFSYCAQIPVLHKGTVRENIIFGAPLDWPRYQEVLEGCALLPDLAEWESGDNTDVGQGGCRLSGGQRLRVGVARALYAFSSVVVLDDPFSALDAHTALHVSRYIARVAHGEVLCSSSSPRATKAAATGGSGTSKDVAERAIVVSTHSTRLLAACTRIVSLSSGKYSECSDDTEAQAKDQQQQQQQQQFPFPWTGAVTATPIEVGEVEGLKANSSGKQIPEQNQDQGQDAQAQEPQEYRAAGAIVGAVYWYYLRAMGVGLALLVLVSTAVMQASSNGMSIYLAYWAAHQHQQGEVEVDGSNRSYSNSGSGNQQFLVIMGAIVAVNTVSTLVRSYSFALAGLIACRDIYKQLTMSVCRAPLSFFDHTPTGQLLNRFGKDSNCIDEQLPFITNIVLQQCFALLGSCATIVYSCPAMVLILVVVFYRYYWLQEYYRSSSRELKRLDAVHRSPIFALLEECVANGPCIRASSGGSGCGCGCGWGDRGCNCSDDDASSSSDSNVMHSNEGSPAAAAGMGASGGCVGISTGTGTGTDTSVGIGTSDSSAGASTLSLATTSGTEVVGAVSGGGGKVGGVGGGGTTDTMRHFEQLFGQAVDESICVSLNLVLAQQWLGVRLQLLGIATSLAIIVLSVLSVVYNVLPMSPGLVGLSLLYSMSVVNTLGGVVNSATEAEQALVSVERVYEYVRGIEDEFGGNEAEDGEGEVGKDAKSHKCAEERQTHDIDSKDGGNDVDGVWDLERGLGCGEEQEQEQEQERSELDLLTESLLPPNPSTLSSPGGAGAAGVNRVFKWMNIGNSFRSSFSSTSTNSRNGYTVQAVIHATRVDDSVTARSNADLQQLQRQRQRQQPVSGELVLRNVTVSYSCSNGTTNHHGSGTPTTTTFPATDVPSTRLSEGDGNGDSSTGDETFNDGSSSAIGLSNISLTIPAGARVAVVGRSGSGKTSLMNMLLRLYPYGDQGSVCLGGVELCTLSKRRVRGEYVYAVPQDPVLFDGSTVRLNMDPEGKFSDVQLLKALQQSGFIDTLRSGKSNQHRQQHMLASDEGEGDDDESASWNMEADAAAITITTASASATGLLDLLVNSVDGDSDNAQSRSTAAGTRIDATNDADGYVDGTVGKDHHQSKAGKHDTSNGGGGRTMGLSLSQGQKQLLCISRMFLHCSGSSNSNSNSGCTGSSCLESSHKCACDFGPHVLLLDEIASSLDTHSREVVRQALLNMLDSSNNSSRNKNRRDSSGGCNSKTITSTTPTALPLPPTPTTPTLLMVVHRLEDALGICDHVLKLHQGTVQYYGPAEISSCSCSDSDSGAVHAGAGDAGAAETAGSV